MHVFRPLTLAQQHTLRTTPMRPSGITVLFFARGRELAGVSEIKTDPHDTPDTAQLIKHLLTRFPRLTEIVATTVLSLNQEYLDQTQVVPLKDGDEVGVIPPLSGG